MSVGCVRDEEDFFDFVINFPVTGKSVRKYKAIADTEMVCGAVGVDHPAAAFQDVTELGVSHDIGAKSSGSCFPNTAGLLPVWGGKAFQGFVSGLAADRAAGSAQFGVREVLGFDANQVTHKLL